MEEGTGVKRKREENDATRNGKDAKQQKKPLRLWVDGCFDLMHYGHANALRQAKNVGDYLVVGVHSDKDIRDNKGPTVMNETERYQAVRACKWADEVVEAAPYTTQLDLIEKYNIDYVVHGDDVSVDANGNDTYAAIKEAGKYKEVKRTNSVSTTDIINRMLKYTKKHYKKPVEDIKELPIITSLSEGPTKTSPYTGVFSFVATGARLNQFHEGKEAKPGDKIVYVDGAFDLFHIGHINLLRKARDFGDFLIVGVHNDDVVNSYKGENNPIMNLYERLLSVLACRYVDEIVIGAPIKPTKKFYEMLNVSVVVHGKDPIFVLPDGTDPFKDAKEMGIFRQVDSESQLSTDKIIARIGDNWDLYNKRNTKKEAKEIARIENEEKTT